MGAFDWEKDGDGAQAEVQKYIDCAKRGSANIGKKKRAQERHVGGKGGGQWLVVGDQPGRVRAECRKESCTNLTIVEGDVEGVEREAFRPEQST
jgi:hypothetical protein